MAIRWIAMLGAAFVLTLLLGGCASGHKQKAWEQKKWYQTDMSTEDKSFFIDTFFNGR
jgi:outer membrane murein-binding lipoprotein Lpp